VRSSPAFFAKRRRMWPARSAHAPAEASVRSDGGRHSRQADTKHLCLSKLAGHACTPDGLGFQAAMRLNYRGSSHARATCEPATSKCMGALCVAGQECS